VKNGIILSTLTFIIASLFACSQLHFKPIKTSPKFDDTRKNKWDEHFKVVTIPSSLDGKIQKARFYKPNTKNSTPLIVSLHTWSGDWNQKDDITDFIVQRELTYIHPDYRGPNWTEEACCSQYAISDIDDAIEYAIKHSNIDTNRIFVVGVSGGGYATLATFMKSKYKIKRFSAWVPISDLVSLYYESLARKNKYANDILLCTHSNN